MNSAQINLLAFDFPYQRSTFLSVFLFPDRGCSDVAIGDGESPESLTSRNNFSRVGCSEREGLAQRPGPPDLPTDGQDDSCRNGEVSRRYEPATSELDAAIRRAG